MKCLFQGEPPAKTKKPPVERSFCYDWRYTFDPKTHKKELTRDWLQYKDGKMYCEVCVEFKDQIMKTGPADRICLLHINSFLAQLQDGGGMIEDFFKYQ